MVSPLCGAQSPALEGWGGGSASWTIWCLNEPEEPTWDKGLVSLSTGPAQTLCCPHLAQGQADGGWAPMPAPGAPPGGRTGRCPGGSAVDTCVCVGGGGWSSAPALCRPWETQWGRRSSQTGIPRMGSRPTLPCEPQAWKSWSPHLQNGECHARDGANSSARCT